MIAELEKKLDAAIIREARLVEENRKLRCAVDAVRGIPSGLSFPQINPHRWAALPDGDVMCRVCAGGPWTSLEALKNPTSCPD